MLQSFLSSFCIIALAHSYALQVVLPGISNIALLNLHVMVARQLNPAFLGSLTIKFIATV